MITNAWKYDAEKSPGMLVVIEKSPAMLVVTTLDGRTVRVVSSCFVAFVGFVGSPACVSIVAFEQDCIMC